MVMASALTLCVLYICGGPIPLITERNLKTTQRFQMPLGAKAKDPRT